MGLLSQLSIVNGFNRDYNQQLLHRIFESNSTSCENEIAVISSNGINKLTYTQLNQAANRIAAVLIDKIKSNDLKPNEDGDWIVAVCMLPSNELIITLLGILKMGAAYLPIDSTFPKSRIDHILEEARPTLTIYDANEINCNIFSDSTAVSFQEYSELSLNYSYENISDELMLPSTGLARLALILYTSGSTGLPKGVRIPHEAISNRLHWQWETFPYSSTEQTCVFKTALTFVDSVSEIWSPLLTGKSLVVVPKYVTRDPSQLVALLEKYNIQRLTLVPTLLKSILIYLSMKIGNNSLSKLKLWICSGETLPVSLANEFYDYFSENDHLLCNFYGSTETMGDVTYFKCHGKEHLRNYTGNVPIGDPIFNTSIQILDAEREPVKVGEIGEIFISGVNLALGYVNNRDTERFIANDMTTYSKYRRMFQTGDFASMQEDRVIHFQGRKDSQVKIRGHRVDLSEIERHLHEILGVKRGIVLCYHPDQIDQTILTFASVESTSNLDAPKIEKLLRNELTEYMKPQVILVDQFPLLVNGKIDRQALLAMYEDGLNNNGFGNNDFESIIEYDFTGISPNELQMARDLFETIGEVIGKSTRFTISLDSNFYDLGGNSLNSIYTVAKLRDRGYYIETTDFVSAINLKEILNGMTEIDENNNQEISICESNGKFVTEPLNMIHKEEAIHLLSKSFAEKDPLSQYLSRRAKYSDYIEIFDAIWEFLIEKECSFIIRDENRRIVGGVLNFLVYDVPELPHNEAIQFINDYLNFVEGLVIDQLPQDKPILYTDTMGTHDSLNAQENIMAITYMESETIRIAKERNFGGILTTNTSELTQQLAHYILGYETLVDFQVNQYSFNGIKPFAKAPDSYRNMVQWKKI